MFVAFYFELLTPSRIKMFIYLSIKHFEIIATIILRLSHINSLAWYD